MIVSKSRKPSRSAEVKGLSSLARVGSTMRRFSAIALSCRRCWKLSRSFGGRSRIHWMPRWKYAAARLGPTPHSCTMWSGESGQQRFIKGHSRGSEQCRPIGTSGSAPASISFCRPSSSGTLGRNLATASVTSVRAKRSPTSGLRNSLFKCITSAELISTPHAAAMYACTATSGMCSSFWEFDALTSIRWCPFPRFSSTSIAT